MKKTDPAPTATGDAKKHLLARVDTHERRLTWTKREEPEPKEIIAAKAKIAAWEKAKDKAEADRKARIERQANLAREAVHFQSEPSAINRVREFELLGPDGK